MCGEEENRCLYVWEDNYSNDDECGSDSEAFMGDWQGETNVTMTKKDIDTND